MYDTETDTEACEITCNKTKIRNRNISAVRVVQEVCVPAMFELEMPVRWTREGGWQLALGEFQPGAEVQIGFGTERTKSLIAGNVTMIAPELDARSGVSSKVSIAGFDGMAKLRFGARTRTFIEQSDHSIVTEVARGAGLAAENQGEPSEPYPYLLQNNESDYTFLRRMCAQRNYELMMDQTKLIYRPSAEGLGAETKRANVQDIEAMALRLSLPQFGSTVKAFGYDVSSGEALSAEVKSGTARLRMGGQKTGYEVASDFPASSIAFERPDLTNAKTIQDFAQAQYALGIGAFIEGELKMRRGDEDLVAGMNLELTGMDAPFNGVYYIYKAVHRYEGMVYKTNVSVRRSGI